MIMGGPVTRGMVTASRPEARAPPHTEEFRQLSMPSLVSDTYTCVWRDPDDKSRQQGLTVRREGGSDGLEVKGGAWGVGDGKCSR